MTKVSYIHGAPEAAEPRRKADKRFINFASMTDGELRLSLMAEQLNILAEYYGKEEYKALENRVIAALQKGIHGHGSIGMVPGRMGQAVAREIVRAQRMKRPAAGIRLKRNLNKGIGSPLIATEDCEQYLEWDEDREGFGQTIQVPTSESRACEERNDNIRMLNQHLEGSAHHLLYEYLATSGNGTVSAKRVLHRNAISKLADITKLERTNLRLWLRNGVMRNNVSHGAPPIQPEDVIDTLKTEGNASVNGAFLAALPALISAIAAAVGSTIALIANIKAQKRQELKLAAQGIGTATFGPEQSDWDFNEQGYPTSSGGSPSGDLLSGDMTPLLLGGAALLLLNN